MKPINRTPSMQIKLVHSISVLILFAVIVFVGCTPAAPEDSLPTENPAIPVSENSTEAPLLPVDADSFYYYADGARVPLQPSLEWIAVTFATEDASQSASALQDSIVDVSKERREIPAPAVTLLPLKPGLTLAQFLAGMNSLRKDHSHFLQVNPVFVDGNTEMIVNDQFIAAFPAGTGKEEIETINSQHGVEIVDALLGQENTFVLRVTENADADTLTVANWYEESGTALFAAPDFIRVTQQ